MLSSRQVVELSLVCHPYTRTPDRVRILWGLGGGSGLYSEHIPQNFI